MHRGQILLTATNRQEHKSVKTLLRFNSAVQCSVRDTTQRTHHWPFTNRQRMSGAGHTDVWCCKAIICTQSRYNRGEEQESQGGENWLKARKQMTQILHRATACEVSTAEDNDSCCSGFLSTWAAFLCCGSEKKKKKKICMCTMCKSSLFENGPLSWCLQEVQNTPRTFYFYTYMYGYVGVSCRCCTTHRLQR